MAPGMILILCVATLLIMSVPFTRSWGYYPTAVIGLILIVLTGLVLMGRI